MTIEDYNNLDFDLKLRWSWDIWYQYLDINAPKFNWNQYQNSYGTRRLFVSGMKLSKRDEPKLKDAATLTLGSNGLETKLPSEFPIPHQRRLFERCNLVKVESPELKRFHWIDFTIAVGETLEITRRNPYRICSQWGIPCLSPQSKEVVEIPMHCISPL